MWIVILGLGLGLAIGFFTPVSVPVALSKYLAIALLAGMDSSLGGLRSGFERHFRLSIFTSGFTFNILILWIEEVVNSTFLLFKINSFIEFKSVFFSRIGFKLFLR